MQHIFRQTWIWFRNSIAMFGYWRVGLIEMALSQWGNSWCPTVDSFPNEPVRGRDSWNRFSRLGMGWWTVSGAQRGTPRWHFFFTWCMFKYFNSWRFGHLAEVLLGIRQRCFHDLTFHAISMIPTLTCSMILRAYIHIYMIYTHIYDIYIYICM